MLKVAVLVSGGGTNLQAIIDAMDNGTITNAKIEVVISNNPNAYALERAKKHNIKALCISPKSYENRAAFNADFLEKLNEYKVDLVVLAGFLVVIPPEMIAQYRNRIINIHPSPDSIFLWNRLLWIKSPRRSTFPWREGNRSYGAFCG